MLPPTNYQSRLTKDIAFATLNWIKSICPLGWKPFSLRTYIVGGNPCEFNKLQRTDSTRTICDQYREYQQKYKDSATVEDLAYNTVEDSVSNTQEDLATVNFSASNMQKPVGKFTPGRDTMRAFAKYVTERTRSKAFLSTYCVRFIEAFAMYARLITQCEKDQEDVLTLFDKKFQCPAKRMLIRTKLVPGQAYPDKRKEYRVILNFAKYDLTNHLHSIETRRM
jgi:hypothetical protein